MRKLTRPYQWLRREAISNLRTMQALGRPRMTRRVPTSGQGDEAAPGDKGIDCKEIGPTEKLARYYAACYVEIPWDERQSAFGMLMSWFGGRTLEWVADECARAGVTAKVSEAEMGEPSAPGIPRTPSETRAARARAPITTSDIAAHDGHIPCMRRQRMRSAGIQWRRATAHAVSQLQRHLLA